VAFALFVTDNTHQKWKRYISWYYFVWQRALHCYSICKKYQFANHVFWAMLLNFVQKIMLSQIFYFVRRKKISIKGLKDLVQDLLWGMNSKFWRQKNVFLYIRKIYNVHCYYKKLDEKHYLRKIIPKYSAKNIMKCFPVNWNVKPIFFIDQSSAFLSYNIKIILKLAFSVYVYPPYEADHLKKY
jgi:hypothetical protein